MAGLQRYAQTWSGDNLTAWETLKYNIRMGLGLALSGVSNAGHDVGGFAGNAPDAELLLRWVECGIFMPRFSIHSWNDDGTVNEPWMHPEVTRHVRDLIKFRAYLEPYLYDLMWRYHDAYEPVWRPTFYDFPRDARCLEDCDEMMLGPSLLVAPVVEPGASRRTVYLPAGAEWITIGAGRRSRAGRASRCLRLGDGRRFSCVRAACCRSISPSSILRTPPTSVASRCFRHQTMLGSTARSSKTTASRSTIGATCRALARASRPARCAGERDRRAAGRLAALSCGDLARDGSTSVACDGGQVDQRRRRRRAAVGEVRAWRNARAHKDERRSAAARVGVCRDLGRSFARRRRRSFRGRRSRHGSRYFISRSTCCCCSG